nr:transcription repressor OFP7-like [Ipomoea batatas]
MANLSRLEISQIRARPNQDRAKDRKVRASPPIQFHKRFNPGSQARRIRLIEVVATQLGEGEEVLDEFGGSHALLNKETALDVFEKIKNPDLVSWNSMIARYAENGDGEKAVRVFVQFLRSDEWWIDGVGSRAVLLAVLYKDHCYTAVTITYQPCYNPHYPTTLPNSSPPSISPSLTPTALPPPSDSRSRPQAFKWRKEENWHVVANIHDETKPRQKIYSSSVSDNDNDEVLALPPLPPPPFMAERKKRRARKKENSGGATNQHLIYRQNSTQETRCEETQIRFWPIHRFILRVQPKKCVAKRGTTPTARRPSVSLTTSSEGELSASSSEGELRSGEEIAQLLMDFKRSMMEMILEKQMFEKDDLEQLLQCFLL